MDSMMYIVTRHRGAVEWIKNHRDEEDVYVLAHMTSEDIDRVAAGDVVVGVLPMPIVARLNAKGVRTFIVRMDVPPEKRGEELSMKDMERLGTSLDEVVVLMGEGLEDARDTWARANADLGWCSIDPFPLANRKYLENK